MLVTPDTVRERMDIIPAAAEIVEAATKAYASDLMDEAMLNTLVEVRDDMGMFLSYFADQKAYRWCGDETRRVMRNIETIASDLIEACGRTD